MTRLSTTALVSGALLLGFTLGTQARGVQTPDDRPVQVHSVNHISVFVRSVEKAAQWHKELLGTEVPTFSTPPKPPLYPAELKWNAESKPKYGHVQLQNARIELQEAVGGGENRWNDYLTKHGQGIEHLGFAVPNVQEALARFQKAGGKLIMGGCPGCTAHVDMRETLGYIVELQPVPRQ